MKWNDPEAKSRQEVRDEKQERDAQEHTEMCDFLRENWIPWCANFKPDESEISREATRRLRAKYAE